MASILVCCTPAHGHVVPTLAVARHLAAAGHDVRVLTGSRYLDRVRDAGLEALALPTEADLDLDHPNDVFPERSALRGAAEVRFSLVNLFVRPGVAQLRAIEQAVAARPVDVVVTEMMFVGAVLLHRRPRAQRPAVVTLGIGPLAAADPDVPPYGLGLAPLRGPLGRLRNAALGLLSRRVVFPPVDRAMDEVFRTVLGTTPAGFSLFDVPSNTDLLLQLTVPGFEYPRPTLPDNVRFVGPLARTAPSGVPVPDWWGDLDGDRPVVHVSQGTIANDDLSQLVLPTLRGLADQDVLVVVSTGGRPVADLGTLPGNARAAQYLPYDLLFPRLAAFVTNGGYGGLHFALEHGVPIVAAGTTEDKIETTARVAWSGAGINLRTERPAPRAVRDAVRRLLTDGRYREASARIGAQIATSPGPAGVERAVADLVPARRG